MGSDRKSEATFIPLAKTHYVLKTLECGGNEP